MKSKLILLAAMLVLLITGCKDSTPVAVQWTDAPTEQHNGKTATLEGYLTLSFGGGYVRLKPRLAAYGVDMGVGITVGDGNNQRKALPGMYRNSDLKVKSDKGEELGYNDYVRITGEYSYDKYAQSLMIKNVSKIEKLTPAPINYATSGAVELTQTNMNQLNKQLVVVEGMLLLPEDAFNLGTGAVLFKLTNEKLGGTINIYPMVGNEPYANSTLTLAEGATIKDVVLFDKNKQPVDLAKKVRIYGTWHNSQPGKEAEFHVEEIEVL